MTTFALSRIGQIAVNVQDLERATAFYRDQLGLRFLATTGLMSFFDADGVRLMLARPEAPELQHPSSILYFEVADVAAAEAELRARGVVFLAGAHKVATLSGIELWMAFFRDSEQNVLALQAHVPVANDAADAADANDTADAADGAGPT